MRRKQIWKNKIFLKKVLFFVILYDFTEYKYKVIKLTLDFRGEKGNEKKRYHE